MAIRSKNIDYESDQMKLSSRVVVGVTATLANEPIFSAPFACKVHFIDLYPQTSPTENSSQSLTVTAHRLGASGTTLQVRTTVLSGSGQRNRLTPSANNSLSTGAAIALTFSATCQVLDKVLVDVIYSPLTHRESR